MSNDNEFDSQTGKVAPVTEDPTLNWSQDYTFIENWEDRIS